MVGIELRDERRRTSLGPLGRVQPTDADRDGTHTIGTTDRACQRDRARARARSRQGRVGTGEMATDRAGDGVRPEGRPIDKPADPSRWGSSPSSPTSRTRVGEPSRIPPITTSGPGGSPRIVAKSAPSFRVNRTGIPSAVTPSAAEPGPGAEHGIPVRRQPCAEAVEALELERGDGAIRLGPHVEQQVAVLAHDVDEEVDQLGDRKVIVGQLRLVVPVGMPDAPARFPLLGGQDVIRGVLGRREIVVARGRWVDALARTRLPFREPLAPSVVDHTVRHVPVVVGEERRKIHRAWTADVVPEDLGGEPVDELTPVTGHVADEVRVLDDARVDVHVAADRSFVERPIEAA